MMKKLIVLMIPLMLVAAACTTDTEVSGDMTVEEAGTALRDLGVDAQGLLADVQTAEAGAQINDILTVVSQNTTTVALAATGGEVSSEDLDRLVSSLGDFDVEIDAVRDSLDPGLVDRMESLTADIRNAVDQLDS
jgi:hypothetical protein